MNSFKCASCDTIHFDQGEKINVMNLKDNPNMLDDFDLPFPIIKQSIKGNAKIIESKDFYRLYVGEKQWMALDMKNKNEINEFYSSYDLSYGDVLLSGLGFGVLAQWIASKPEVKSVTVVEFSQDVVDIFLENNKLHEKIKLVVQDIGLYKDTKTYDWAIFDHYEGETQPTKQEIEKICNNIKFNNLWFWSLEYRLIERYNSWSKFRNDYSLKIPDLSLNQINKYIMDLYSPQNFILKE